MVEFILITTCTVSLHIADYLITNIHYEESKQFLVLNFNQDQFLIKLSNNDHFFTTHGASGKYMYGDILRDNDPVGWASIILNPNNIIVSHHSIFFNVLFYSSFLYYFLIERDNDIGREHISDTIC